MSAAAETTMAEQERKDIPFQIRCSASWLERIQFAADALGLSAAAYIRMVTIERMNQDGIPTSPPPQKKPKRK